MFGDIVSRRNRVIANISGDYRMEEKDVVRLFFEDHYDLRHH